MSWVDEELASCALGDKRLNDRLRALVAALAEQPEASVPQACGDWWDTKGAYRFWDNDRVHPAAILAGHAEQTAQRCQAHELVLVIQDTTEINLSHHPATQGLGYLANPDCQGLLAHTLLAVSTTGIPLGILAQRTWVRDAKQLGSRHRRHQHVTGEKESQRWLDGLATAQTELPDQSRVVVIGDRESDIFDLFTAPRRARVDLLVRMPRGRRRRIDHPAGNLDQALQELPRRASLTINVPRADQRPSRTAKLALRYGSFAVHAPHNGKGRSSNDPTVRLQFVLIEESRTPAGGKPISWLLATTLPLDSIADARRCVEWYLLRWRIERFHYLLKSGCRIEQRELETLERFERALATYSIVAWRLLWLTYEARQNPEAPCNVALETHEWQSLYATLHQTTKLPARPPSLRDALRMIARLGGFLARKSDGEPGVKTLWRGMQRLKDISNTWKLLTDHPPPKPNVVGNA